MTEESDIIGEITAREVNAYLEGDAELESLADAFEKMLELMKKTGQAKAKLVITIKNDLADETEEEDQAE